MSRIRPSIASKLAAALLVTIAFFAGSPPGASAKATARASRDNHEARVSTDGRLRPGHFETIHVSGFPGRGRTEVAFFPTAICGDECEAARRLGAKTNAAGSADIRVRVPGTFVARNGKHVYFRDGERIDLEVTWNGAHEQFDVSSASPDPIILRTHKAGASGQPLFVPSSFQLQGTNGYSIFVSGLLARDGKHSTVDISAYKHHMGVSYRAPAVVTETSMHAILGELGEISVEFERTGQAKVVGGNRRNCGPPVSFDSGSFVGRIDFHGEEGFTEVEATSAPGAVGLFCGSFGTGRTNFKSRGAELFVRNPGLGPAFDVVKQRPGAVARFEAGISEYRESIVIDRTLTADIAPGAFRYDQRLQTATLQPPAPFSGTATFDRHRRVNRRWQGDLTVDLPGHADVPLVGPTLRAYLVRPRF